jgi:hypothetical protein
MKMVANRIKVLHMLKLKTEREIEEAKVKDTKLEELNRLKEQHLLQVPALDSSLEAQVQTTPPQRQAAERGVGEEAGTLQGAVCERDSVQQEDRGVEGED